MSNYLSFIITHGTLAKEINNVAQNFIKTDLPVYTYSNAKDSIENIIEKIEQKVLQHKPDKIIIFVDLMGGSCWQAAMRVKKNQADIAILSGINIPALVSFASNYKRLSWDELIEKIKNSFSY